MTVTRSACHSVSGHSDVALSFGQLATAGQLPALDLVIPVYNEEAQLGQSVRRPREYLSTSFPIRFGSPSPTAPFGSPGAWRDN
ncbi:MAG: hypothetical protein M3256_15005 [Actinomycetota bacterium]|nr:hypothetical protein [Candidatus Dormibacteraeota bacterium]MDQ6947537.1 hypothetical protein [Actinomycetota bacterium]